MHTTRRRHHAGITAASIVEIFDRHRTSRSLDVQDALRLTVADVDHPANWVALLVASSGAPAVATELADGLVDDIHRARLTGRAATARHPGAVIPLDDAVTVVARRTGRPVGFVAWIAALDIAEGYAADDPSVLVRPTETDPTGHRPRRGHGRGSR